MDQGTHLRVAPHARPRVALAVAAIGALDLTLVTLLLTLDTAQVQSQQELARVRLGLPLDWVTQNQSIDPPLPWRTGFMLPQEQPTTIAWLPLVVNLFIIAVLLTAAWAGVAAARGRRRATGGPPGSGRRAPSSPSSRR